MRSEMRIVAFAKSLAADARRGHTARATASMSFARGSGFVLLVFSQERFQRYRLGVFFVFEPDCRMPGHF